MPKTELEESRPASFRRAIVARQPGSRLHSFPRAIALRPSKNFKNDQGANEPTCRETLIRDSTIPRNHASAGKPKRSSSKDRNAPAERVLAARGLAAEDGEGKQLLAPSLWPLGLCRDYNGLARG